MTTKHIFSVLFLLQFVGLNAYAFSGQDHFRVELVKPWGEFGFRALGKGKNLSEMRFDCSRAHDMGLVVSTIDGYGKSGHTVLPAVKLGSDRTSCQKKLKQYFANAYTKRSLASLKTEHTYPVIELRFEQSKTISFR